MFDSLRSRFRKKDYDDVEDIRSSVLGDFRMAEQPQPDACVGRAIPEG